MKSKESHWSQGLTLASAGATRADAPGGAMRHAGGLSDAERPELNSMEGDGKSLDVDLLPGVIDEEARSGSPMRRRRGRGAQPHAGAERSEAPIFTKEGLKIDFEANSSVLQGLIEAGQPFKIVDGYYLSDGSFEATPEPMVELEADGKAIHWPLSRFSNSTKPYKLIACRCKRWTCPECSRIKAYHVRSRLLAKCEAHFKEPRLFTLTIDRENFTSPFAAYCYVMEKKVIPRLMNAMRIPYWYWVMEAQSKTGDGWPHWHFLIDVSHLPSLWYNKELKEYSEVRPKGRGWILINHCVDEVYATALVKKWGISRHLKLSPKNVDLKSPAHAVNYITKYQAKYPENGYPLWMCGTASIDPKTGDGVPLINPTTGKAVRIRFCQPSKSLGAIFGDGIQRELRKSEKRRKQSPDRCAVDAVSECRSKCLAVEYATDGKPKVMQRLDEYGNSLGPYPPRPALKDSFSSRSDVLGVSVETETGDAYMQYFLMSRESVESYFAVWRSPLKQFELKIRAEERKSKIFCRWTGENSYTFNSSGVPVENVQRVFSALERPDLTTTQRCRIYGLLRRLGLRLDARDAAEGSAFRQESPDPPRDFSFRPPASLQAAKAEPLGQAEAETAGLSEGRNASLSGSPQGEKLAFGCEHCPSPPFPGAEGKSRQLDLFESLSRTA